MHKGDGVETDLKCFFVSDLHGDHRKYRKLLEAVTDELPQMIFIGGDILPGGSFVSALDFTHEDFLAEFLAPGLRDLRERIGGAYPQIFVILGNDDGRFAEQSILDMAVRGHWHYVHNRRLRVRSFSVYGYCYVPPSPYQLKDWERYDVSRYVDPGCVPPEEGIQTIPVSEEELKYSTIQNDLERLAGEDDLDNAVFLFHSPPYQTNLDRAALDEVKVDHVPLDVHVGSIAIKRFIESRQPLLTLHGHIHESTRLTGIWKERCGRTWMFNAAHDGPELVLIRFSPMDLAGASRELI
jgi:Icc-related predicted phosphoesterase